MSLNGEQSRLISILIFLMLQIVMSKRKWIRSLIRQEEKMTLHAFCWCQATLRKCMFAKVCK